MSAGPARYWSGPAPTLGQHTDEVLRDELGVTDDELARLRDEHVIGTTPVLRLTRIPLGRVAGVLEREEPELDALAREQIEDALVDGDVAVPAGHRAGRAAARQLPHRLLRHVRVEHRHVDAERRARRVRATS